MLEHLSEIEHWLNTGKRFAMATVIKTWGSSPRPIGSKMLISDQQEMVGSVSGGCVEGTVVRMAQRVLETNVPELVHFGVSDEDAWSVGLSCGGKIDVWIAPFIGLEKDPNTSSQWTKLHDSLKHNHSAILFTALTPSAPSYSLFIPDGEMMGALQSDDHRAIAQRTYEERKHQQTEIDGQPYFIEVFPRKPQLLIVGAAHITTDLVALGQYYDFETVVIDPRGIFANKTQFPTPPDQLFVQWPAEVIPSFTLDAYSFAVLLTHDPKIDDQALALLLPSKVAYIGALGSKRTHAKRVSRLTEKGFSQAQIDRIYGPIGVSINARRPKEIALSIIAQIIQIKNA